MYNQVREELPQHGQNKETAIAIKKWMSAGAERKGRQESMR